MNRLRIAIAAIAIGGLLAAAAPAQAVTVRFSGSTSIFPLMVALIKEYKKEGHKSFSAAYTQGGSDIGVRDASQHPDVIGTASRDPLPDDPHGLTFTRIAFDAVCVITSNRNPVPNLNQDQVRAIFNGSIQDWSGVPGAAVQGPIQRVVRQAGSSGTAEAFQNIFMGTGPGSTISGADEVQSNGTVQSTVANDSNGLSVGYVSLDFTGGVHAVPYNGRPCTLANAKTRKYPGIRNFWVVSRGKLSGAGGAFVDWIRRSRGATKVVGTHWVPIHS